VHTWSPPSCLRLLSCLRRVENHYNNIVVSFQGEAADLQEPFPRSSHVRREQYKEHLVRVQQEAIEGRRISFKEFQEKYDSQLPKLTDRVLEGLQQQSYVDITLELNKSLTEEE
jgi:hypothetical protein